MSKVSICITTYNRASSLAKTLDSILNQTFTDFELIISDDNSTDGTREICEAYSLKDCRVKYFRNESNLKMPGNLNNAISKASGEFIANLHDGDIYKADLIEKWLSKLVSNPSALFVFNQYNSFDADGNYVLTHKHNLDCINNGSLLLEYALNTMSSGPWGTVMVRKAAYDQYGLFNPKYGFISDIEMWLRLSLHGDVAYVNEPLIDLTPREISHPYYYPHWKIFCINCTIIISYYRKYLNKGKYIDTNNIINKFFKKMEEKAIKDLLLLIKTKQCERVREGLFLFSYLPIKNLQRFRNLLFWIAAKKPQYINEIEELTNEIISVRNIK